MSHKNLQRRLTRAGITGILTTTRTLDITHVAISG